MKSEGNKDKYEEVVISTKDKAEKCIEIAEKGTVICWEFNVESYDIGFSVAYRKSDEDEVLPFGINNRFRKS